MRAFSNEGFMDLEVELMLLRRKKARGQNQTVQVIKARHMAELEQVKEGRFFIFILAGDSSTVSSPSPHTAAGTSSPLGEQPWA